MKITPLDIRRALRLLHEMLVQRPDTGWPEDPVTPVREPVHRRPGGRGTAVAVAEPDPPLDTDLVASSVRGGVRR